MPRRIIQLLIVTCGLAIVPISAWLTDALSIREAWAGTSSYSAFGTVERLRAIPPYLQGRRAAQLDLRRGCLRVKTWGLPRPSRAIAAELYDKQLGVSMCVVGGCITTPSVEASWIGYNEVMLPAIERRFGKASLERLDQRANQLFEQRRERGELPWQIAANHGRIIPIDDGRPHWKD